MNRIVELNSKEISSVTGGVNDDNLSPIGYAIAVTVTIYILVHVCIDLPKIWVYLNKTIPQFFKETSEDSSKEPID